MKYAASLSMAGYALVAGLLLTPTATAEDVPAWLSGPPETKVPQCLQNFFEAVKETAGVEQAGSFRSLAEKRLANLVNRAWEDRRNNRAERYQATLIFLYTKPDGTPKHFRFQMSGEKIDRLGSSCQN